MRLDFLLRQQLHLDVRGGALNGIGRRRRQDLDKDLPPHHMVH